MLFIFVTILIVLIFYNNYISLTEIQSKLKKGTNLPDNVKIIATYFDENNVVKGYIDTYIKDDKAYIAQCDKNNNKYAENIIYINDYNISIVHDTKNIFKTKQDRKIEASGIDEFSSFVALNPTYKYHGKEKINNDKCIKISFLVENFDNVEQNYYYISVADNHIVKIENYRGTTKNDMSLMSSTVYEYTYGTVLDSDILDFDQNNYMGYEYNEI